MSNSQSTPAIEKAGFRWSALDSLLVWIVSIYGGIAALALLIAPRFLLPAEDAVILFQFSRNLAHTAAITYVPGGIHAEGATDFGWMVLLALGIKIGVSPFWLVALLNVVSLVLIGVLLIKIAGCKVNALALLFIAGSLALMPQIFAAVLGFSTLSFACLLVLLCFYFLQQNDMATPAAALALCLFRPDGVVFAIPLLIAALIIYPHRLRRLGLDTAIFVLPGVLYFLWRWHYFGELLPLPFLVKSAVHRVAHILVLNSVHRGQLLCFFSAILLWFILRDRMADPRNRAVLLCLVILPNLFYFAMRLEQNIGHRFSIYLPVGTAILLAMNWQQTRSQHYFLLRVGLAAWIIFICRIWIPDAHEIWPHQLDNRTAIAREMATLPHGIIVLTEAGVLPYYSQWPSNDAWGLNTARFSRHLIQPSDVAQINPDVMLVFTRGTVAGGTDACTPQADWETPYAARSWQGMTRNLIAAAPADRYNLWSLPYGNLSYRAHLHLESWQGGQECWLIRRDSPLRQGVEDILVRHHGLTDQQFRTLVPLPETSPTSLDTQPVHQRPVRARSLLQKVKARVSKLWHLLDE